MTDKPPIVIPLATPHNVIHSNGIRVYLEIALAAQKLGYDVSLCPAIDCDANNYIIPKPYSGIKVCKEVLPSAIALLGDVISDWQYSYIRSKVSSVCHYAGAPYGLFSGVYGNRYRGVPGDTHAVHSPFVSTAFPFFYYQPVHYYLSQWLNCLPSTCESHTVVKPSRNSLRVCIYSGKGHLSSVDPAIRALVSRSESSLITRHWPPSKDGLRELILKSDAVISFDLLSSLAFEATLLGKPCLVVSNWDEAVDIESFPVCLDGISFNSVSRFLEILCHGYDYHAVVGSYYSAISANNDIVKSLLDFAQGRGESTKPAPGIDAGAYWSSRIDFLSSLGLPSKDVPSINAALPAFFLQEYASETISAILRRLPRFAVVFIKGLLQKVLMKCKNFF